MQRPIQFFACLIAGTVLMVWASLLPAYIRAVDSEVIEQAGEDTPSLAEEGLKLVSLEKIGPAKMISLAANKLNLPQKERLEAEVMVFSEAHPELLPLGGSDPFLEQLLQKSGRFRGSQPIIDLILPQETRIALLEALQNSRRPGVQEVLRTRNLTNTVEFPPATSSSGQPLDAAIVLTALLSQGDHLTQPLRDAVEGAATVANRGQDIRPLEHFYLDLLSLGTRLNWVQLTDLLGQVEDMIAVRDLARLIREREPELPLLYSAVHFSGSPGAAARYVVRFADSGVNDLRFSLIKGKGALRELLQKQKPIHFAQLRKKMLAQAQIEQALVPFVRIARNAPLLSLVFKYDLLLMGGFLIGLAIKYLAPFPAEEERLINAPQLLLAACLLLVVMVLSEPFLLPSNPATESSLRWKFPMVHASARPPITKKVTAMMIDQYSLLSLIFFFVVQAAIYAFCRYKLAEIARQPVPSKLKLKLLENEDHLFDAGLYCGFVGTVISLIFVSLGVIKPSLMAAYSSTSFGIIFVSILKIFHIRPLRRKLILQSETAAELQVA